MKKKEKLKRAVNLSITKNNDLESTSLFLRNKMLSTLGIGGLSTGITSKCMCYQDLGGAGGCKTYTCNCTGYDIHFIFCPDGYADYYIIYN